ncbi:MAG: FHA domain-containing protein [Pseudomonadota bacterium]
MATIANSEGGKQRIRPLHIFGRQADRVDTLLLDPEASHIHATLRWTGALWLLTDHSTNGTWVNGDPIVSKQGTAITADYELQFGSPNVQAWSVMDVDAPRSVLIDPHEHETPIDGFIDLSDSDNATAIYETGVGDWVIERDGHVRPLKHMEVVELADKRAWTFWDGTPPADTVELSRSIPEPSFEFEVSLDEEHVRVLVTGLGEPISLGERNHHYLMLTLARRWLEDMSAGTGSDHSGWLDSESLSTMLGLTREHMNIQVCRLRQQLSGALGQTNAHEIVQRRPGQVRLRATGIRIVKGPNVMSYP